MAKAPLSLAPSAGDGCTFGQRIHPSTKFRTYRDLKNMDTNCPWELYLFRLWPTDYCKDKSKWHSVLWFGKERTRKISFITSYQLIDQGFALLDFHLIIYDRLSKLSISDQNNLSLLKGSQYPILPCHKILAIDIGNTKIVNDWLTTIQSTVKGIAKGTP